MKSILRNIYRTTRGILFTVIIFLAVVYLAIYVLLSVPEVQERIKNVAEKEASAYIGSDVKIGSLSIFPFNEVVLNNLEVTDHSGVVCVKVGKLGVGISLMRLVEDRHLEFTYAEVIGLDARIYQDYKDSALNIGFIVDAFKPKDKSKPPTKFNLNLRNVVLRRCNVSFNRNWIPEVRQRVATDFNHLRITDLNADLNIPEISNDVYDIDLRRLAFEMSGGLKVEKIAMDLHVEPSVVSARNMLIKFGESELYPSDIVMRIDGYADILPALKRDSFELQMIDNTIVPSDFSWILPELSRYSEPMYLSLDAEGNLSHISLNKFKLVSPDNLNIEISANIEAPDSIMQSARSEFRIDRLMLRASSACVAEIMANLAAGKDVAGKFLALGDVELDATASGSPFKGNYNIDAKIVSTAGAVDLKCDASGLKKGAGSFSGEVVMDNMNVGKIAGQSNVGNVSAVSEFHGRMAGKDIDGDVSVEVSHAEYNGVVYGGVGAYLEKEDKEVSAHISLDDTVGNGEFDMSAYLDGEDTQADVKGKIRYFHPDYLGLLPKYEGYTLSGMVEASLHGNNADNLTGKVSMKDFDFYAKEKKSVTLSNLTVEAEADSLARIIRINSDLIDGEVKGHFKFKELGEELVAMAGAALPSLVSYEGGENEFSSDAEFSFLLKANNTLTEFFNLPFRMLVDVPVKGAIDGTGNSSWLTVNVPFIQQGNNKLVRDSRLDVKMDGETESANIGLTTTFPAKKGDMNLMLNVMAQSDNVLADVDWETPSNREFNGKLTMSAEISRDEFSHKPEISVDIHPSRFDFGLARWDIDQSRVTYDDGILKVDDLRIWHGNQYVDINGVASANPEDSITIQLADIDVGYVFDTLNINYVAFGGIATGTLTASGALGGNPVAGTDNLVINGMSYNGCVLGDGKISSHWDNEQKMVAIGADIKGKGDSRSLIDGGIWVTRDSLSFGIDADRVPVGFLAPFMNAFASEVGGYASGRAKLYGTFSDIDLTGRIFADSIGIKLGFTNVAYHGRDSVILNPGHIEIPSFRIYDKFGNSGILSGELTHRYFHEPTFDFQVSDVRRMLCYDTNSTINPDWYGTIFGTGRATIKGYPGTVAVSVDMTATERSSFTFVLNDTQAAEEYRFLTFTDKRKEMAEKLRTDTISAIISAFQKKIDADNSAPSRFMIDLRGTVTPATLMTIVMDPIAGDRITARGNGNLQMDYDSESEDFQMFGKYTLDEGNYNFSLQDLILRDFKIREGSNISFNGDPFNARLDITASYRVNTNLTDLDKSFSTDKEIARTNVPVDALLMVNGEMQHPEISFDIELPTLTQDVERKVKSIISTDDMMSRQIIYLLALNRFYTPEYMGAQSNGGEFASVASSTLSSQLQSMLGQLTDKFTVAPAFRSDKGDFSDIEVDVALSSRLLNNRLLVNGNFGYRDRTTSSTTFVGDFDIEYLLNRSGNLRLKAYNHFNDQNYYLRQALTTQGLGIIYRRDFDNPFTFLRKRKPSNDKEYKVAADSVQTTDNKEVENDSREPGKDDAEETLLKFE